MTTKEKIVHNLPRLPRRKAYTLESILEAALVAAKNGHFEICRMRLDKARVLLAAERAAVA